MAKAILTQFKSPTESKGSRIRASAQGVKSISVPYHDGLSLDENHQRAAIRLAQLQGWPSDLIGGSLPNQDMAWVKAR